jgi:hypothetical protein
VKPFSKSDAMYFVGFGMGMWLYADQYQWWQKIVHLGILIVLFVVIKGFLYWIFRLDDD